MLITRFGTISSQMRDNFIPITIDSTKISGTLSNFTVTVILNSGNFDFTSASSDGTDIYFKMNDIELYFERDNYDNVNKKASFYVKLPTISSVTDTVFGLYIGSATDKSDKINAWDTHYDLVHHMGSNLTDSTNGHTFDKYGSPIVLEDGVLHNRTKFTNNTNDYYRTSMTLNFPLTFSFAHTIDSNIGYPRMIEYFNSTSAINLSYMPYYSGIGTFFCMSGIVSTHEKRNDILSTSNVGDRLVVNLTFTSTTDFQAYVNGELRTVSTVTDSYGGATSEGVLQLSRRTSTAATYSNTIDEFRISNIVRSASWLMAEQHDLANTLVTIGSV